jgi:choloylglycine hydrolase
MCTDLRLVRLADRHISARTMDFDHELQSRLQVVPRGQDGSATPTLSDVPTLTWQNPLGFVGMDAFGFPWAICDGLNEAGLSVGTLWLPETTIPTEPPTRGQAAAVDFINLAAWLLGTCSTVGEVRSALAGVQIWNAPVGGCGPRADRCRTWCGHSWTTRSPSI